MFPVPAAPLIHLILETLGVALAMLYYRRLRSRTPDPITDDHRMLLLIAAAAGALLGSRMVGALESPELFWSGGGADGAWYYWRSKTIVGGLVGGLFAVEVIKLLVGIRHRSGDLYVYPLLTAMIVGRVGCFLMGVGEPTHGMESTAWAAMDLGDGKLRHPTALYEIVFLSCLFFAGTQVQRRFRVRPGRLFMLFLSAYLVYRLAVGFIQPGVRLGGLTTIQWTCIVGLAWYLVDELLTSRTPTYARR